MVLADRASAAITRDGGFVAADVADACDAHGGLWASLRISPRVSAEVRKKTWCLRADVGLGLVVLALQEAFDGLADALGDLADELRRTDGLEAVGGLLHDSFVL